MECNKCGGKTSVGGTNENPEYHILEDFHTNWILRERKCKSCFEKMTTAEVAISDLKKLSDIHKRQLASEKVITKYFKNMYSNVMDSIADLYSRGGYEPPHRNSR